MFKNSQVTLKFIPFIYTLDAIFDEKNL